jgi:hypothetical protein
MYIKQEGDSPNEFINEEANLMDLAGGTDELEIFETESMQQLI